jgi:DNA-binding CsgD family transcriptional regulator
MAITPIADAKPVRLSPRERQVLRALAGGYRGTELAEHLHVSPETIRTHVRNSMRKLDARTRVEAVAIALEAGLVSRGDETAARAGLH